MKKSDLKEIGSLIGEELEPIKKTLEVHGQILDRYNGQLESISAKLDEHSGKLDSLTLDMIEVQRKTDSIRDIHALVRDTRETVNDHEQRIETLENPA